MSPSAILALNSPARSTQDTAQETEALKNVWKTINVDSCPHHYNFHLHSICSDGRLKPKQIVEQVLTIGLKGFTITDHHSVEGYYIARDYLAALEQKFKKASLHFPRLWIGVEITAQLLGIDIHILGYGFDPSAPSIRPYLQGNAPEGIEAQCDRVITALKKAGGLVVLAHPERYRLPAGLLIDEIVKYGIDGLETYYNYRNTNPWKPSPTQTETVKQYSEKYGLYNTCGTDTHGYNLLLKV